jgi:hypothetical protein
METNVKKLLTNLENSLINFYNSLPQLADYLEQPLIKFLPYLSVILGLLSFYSAYGLWHAAHTANSLITYANSYGNLYGVQKVHLNHHMSVAFWLAIVTLVFEGVLFIKAFGATKNRLKSGWDLVYSALVVNVVYGIILMFSYYGGIGTLGDRLLFSLICLYFLFEIRDAYSGDVSLSTPPVVVAKIDTPKKTTTKKKPVAKKKPAKKKTAKK